jgi:hypothetical protein
MRRVELASRDSLGYVRVAMRRLGKRHREVLRAEIGQTLVNRDLIEEELRALFRAFAG